MNINDVVKMILKKPNDVICNPNNKECLFIGCYERNTGHQYYGIKTPYGTGCFFKLKRHYETIRK